MAVAKTGDTGTLLTPTEYSCDDVLSTQSAFFFYSSSTD